METLKRVIIALACFMLFNDSTPFIPKVKEVYPVKLAELPKAKVICLDTISKLTLTKTLKIQPQTDLHFVYVLKEILADIRKESPELLEGLTDDYIITVAALESYWGRSSLTDRSNNLFCIKGNYNGASSWELDDGLPQPQAFRRYPNWKSSVKDFICFLRKYKRYKKVFYSKKPFKEMRKAGYATAKHYVSACRIRHKQVLKHLKELEQVKPIVI